MGSLVRPLLPLRQKVPEGRKRGRRRMTRQGLQRDAGVSATPHPALRATFPRKGGRGQLSDLIARNIASGVQGASSSACPPGFTACTASKIAL